MRRSDLQSLRLVALPEPFRLSELRGVKQDRGDGGVREKPDGLWYSCGTEWIDWLLDEMPWRKWKYLYSIKVDTKRIRLIRTEVDLTLFDDEFGLSILEDDGLDYRQIDWVSVAKSYDGIEICPYQPRMRGLDWYEPWDVASGCIWRRRALTKIEQIDVPEDLSQRGL